MESDSDESDRIGVLYRGELIELTEPAETSRTALTELIASGSLPGVE